MTKRGLLKRVLTISEHRDCKGDPMSLTSIRSFVKPVPFKVLNTLLAQLRS
jgi:hypothetical protein